jgi:hypothetical protein
MMSSAVFLRKIAPKKKLSTFIRQVSKDISFFESFKSLKNTHTHTNQTLVQLFESYFCFYPVKYTFNEKKMRF